MVVLVTSDIDRLLFSPERKGVAMKWKGLEKNRKYNSREDVISGGLAPNIIEIKL